MSGRLSRRPEPACGVSQPQQRTPVIHGVIREYAPTDQHEQSKAEIGRRSEPAR